MTIQRIPGLGFYGHYVLDADHRAQPSDMVAWHVFRSKPENAVLGQDYVPSDGLHRAFVSTVFIGMPALESTKERVLLFETRVFGGKLDTDTTRHATWGEAVAGHAAMLARVTAAEATS